MILFSISLFVNMSMNSISPFSTVTIWLSSMYITWFVCSINAGMSEAMKYSPFVFPFPMINGEPFRAATTMSSFSQITTSAYRPSISSVAFWTASLRGRFSRYFSIKCAITSVSVSDSNLWPSFLRRFLTSVKFSRTPLWTITTSLLSPVCGCAFFLEMPPCVAHLV